MFHDECFKTDINIPLDVDRQSLREDQTIDERFLPLQNEEDFEVGTMSRETSEKLLAGRVPGTFMLRFSRKRMQPVISRKTEGSVEHLPVSQSQVAGLNFYTLMMGHGRRSTLDLVNNHREDLSLLYPINSPPAKLSSEEENKTCTKLDLERRMSQESVDDIYVEFNDDNGEVGIEENPDIVVVVADEGSYQEYNHGTISRFDAEVLLASEVEGTFLLRVCQGGGLRLSRVPHRSGNLSKHFIVHRDRHNHFYLTSNEKFSTVEELIRFYQNVDNGDKYWLGGPLYTQQALNKVRVSQC